jgi:glucose-6-phosphate isomerase
MAATALVPYHSTDVRCHFVANLDGAELDDLVDSLAPDETIVVVASKSFTTLETRINADAMKAWFRAAGFSDDDLSRHFLAVTANTAEALSFGVPIEQIFPMWDWVGGRYSLWSAVGLTLSVLIGPSEFGEMLAGANEMDVHFRDTPLPDNLPVIVAMVGIWYNNFFDAETHAVIPYDHHLRLLPSFLQQLEMESNGKSVTSEGTPVGPATAPIVWGGEGTNSQHSFHQLLFQGTRLVPVDFIVSLESHGSRQSQHDWLYASCVGQSEALMIGKRYEDVFRELLEDGMSREDATDLAPHKVVVGNKPSNTIVLRQKTPRALGALIALYEHKVFCQGIIWRINSFDQWGVELGKRLGEGIHASITGDRAPNLEEDSSTRGLIDLYRSRTMNP